MPSHSRQQGDCTVFIVDAGGETKVYYIHIRDTEAVCSHPYWEVSTFLVLVTPVIIIINCYVQYIQMHSKLDIIFLSALLYGLNISF